MPELPEVETVKNVLQTHLAGLYFTGIKVLLQKIIRTPGPEEFESIIAGKKIIRVDRRGKYLAIVLSDNLTLLVHLRMTGRLVYHEQDRPAQKHTHAILLLSNGGQLHFSDTRQFGRLWLVANSSLDSLPGYKDLGVEPLGEDFTRDCLKKLLRGRHARIKPLLLDQSLVAGLGNIYADEALYRARVNPERLAATLTSREVARLHQAIRDVLQESIIHRGTTVRDFLDGSGRAGGFQAYLRIYGREGHPCSHCGRPIVKKKIGGRSSYYCPACQKVNNTRMTAPAPGSKSQSS